MEQGTSVTAFLYILLFTLKEKGKNVFSTNFSCMFVFKDCKHFGD